MPLYQRAVEIREREGNTEGTAVVLSNLSDTLRLSGALRGAEMSALQSLGICRQQGNRFQEAVNLYWAGLVLATNGKAAKAEIALKRAMSLFSAQGHQTAQGQVSAYLAQRLLGLAEPEAALSLALRSWELAHVDRIERDFICAARLHGTAALGMGDLETAAERLEHALTRARAVDLVEEELPALTALAELWRQKQDFSRSRELLDHVWAYAERGPYPLFHADALNVLCQIERDEGHDKAAATAAKRAFALAWSDGPPYAYEYGLSLARHHLAALGVAEPSLAPFDPSAFDPMPDVELNPADELHV